MTEPRFSNVLIEKRDLSYLDLVLCFGDRVLERAIDAFPINIICSNRAGHPGLFRHPSTVSVNERIQRIHQLVHKRVEGGLKHIGQLFADTGVPGAVFQRAVLRRKMMPQSRIAIVDAPFWIFQLLGKGFRINTGKC